MSNNNSLSTTFAYNILSKIIDFVPYCIFWKDVNGIFLGCNRKFANFAGKENMADIIGKTDYDMPWRRFAKEYLRDDQKVIRSKQPVYNQLELNTNLHANDVTVTVSKFPVLNDFGETVGVLGIYYDIAIGRDREASLLHEIIAYIPYHIFWKNKKGQFLGCNTPFALAAGFKDPTEVIGKTDLDMSWAIQADKYLADDLKVIESGKPQIDIEDLQTRPDGTEVVALVSKVPLINQDGEAYGVLGIYNDITERKKQERELVVAKQMAEKANKVKSDFIANMSHDVRTPITAMLGLTQSIYNGADNPKTVKKNAKLLQAATNQILNIFNEVMATIEAESDQTQEQQLTLFSPKKLVENNIKLIQPALNLKHIDFEFHSVDTVPTYLRGKKILFDRIILNLLSNAVKFTEKGQISLTLSTIKRTKTTCRLQLVIRDTGIGIPANQLSKIFDKLYRINPSYNSEHSGYGLGLYFVKCAVDALNGRVSVDSSLNEGTVFTINCPFKIAQQSVVSAPKEKTPTDKQVMLQGARILLIEDHELVANMQKDLFESLGCIIEIASTASIAKSYLIKNSYDLILIDLGLPDMGGIELAQFIREELALRIPIIAITGHGSHHDRIQCLTAGMQEMFIKPITKHTAKIIAHRYIEVDNRPSDACIDLAYGAKLINQDTLATINMLNLFNASIDDDLSVIVEACQNKDYLLMQKQLHRLRGGLSYCGLPALKKVAEILAEALHEDPVDFTRVEGLLKKMNKEIDRFRKALKKL
ncbi:MAG: hypothetical protein A3F17_00920 [Gammaproteobacteria bacterium RIFCSPHIGHO2_12_FULL_41_15]|nr:MAG: hypothetical protein A3F17_00920 [Gammaproteobacteria bacterium RIFCSPHIGHO2_12_FULL_41_15]